MACVIATVASFLITSLAFRYAVAKQLLDLPSWRSLHARPTPRGGGLGIAVAVLSGIVAAGVARWVPLPVAVGLGGGVLGVALIGWVDDHRKLPPLMRLAVHLASATWAVAWLGGCGQLVLGSASLPLGNGGFVLAVLGVTWATNLYNFMDGIDMIAATEGVLAGAIVGALLASAGRPGLACVAFVVAGASAGFLPWNWSPARIFMGDVGSGVLGFSFAALALASEISGGPPVTVWVLLLGVFVFDATVTLLRRMIRGDRWYQAHRSHAYQRAVLAGWTHTSVSGAVAVLTIGMGLLAAIATARPQLTLLCALLGGGILSAVYLLVERAQPMASTLRSR